jgi:hypothetical protein
VNQLSREASRHFGTRTYMERTLNRDHITLRTLSPDNMPSSNYRDHYFSLIKQRGLTQEQLEREEVRNTRVSNILLKCQYWCQLPASVLAVGAIYLVLVLQAILIVVFWHMRNRKNWSDDKYVLFLSPILLVATYFPLAVNSWLISYRVLKDHELKGITGIRCCLKHACITLFSWFLSAPVFLIVLNLGVLPRSAIVTAPKEQLFRRELIPWHVVFAPWIISSFFCGAVMSYFILGYILEEFKRYPSLDQLVTNLMKDYRNEGVVLALMNCLLYVLAVTFILLGIHLEFATNFHIAFVFIPLVIFEVFSQIIAIVFYLQYVWKLYPRFENHLIYFIWIILPLTLLLGHIPFCFEKWIGPWGFLSLILLPGFNIYLIITRLCWKYYHIHSFMNDSFSLTGKPNLFRLMSHLTLRTPWSCCCCT